MDEIRQTSAIFNAYNFIENNTMSASAVSVYSEADGISSEANTQVGRLEGLVSREVVETMENVVNIGVIPVFVVIGVITNIINMAVFRHQGLADRINICLFGLSLADLAYLVFMMAGESHSILSLVDRQLGWYWKLSSQNSVVGMYRSFMTISSVLTMIISLERCACVLAPLHARSLIRARSMAAVIVCVFVFTLGLYGVYNVKYVTITRTDPTNPNRTVYVARLGSFYLQHRVVIDVIYKYLLTVTIPTTSLVVVIISTAITITQLHLSLAWRKETAQQSIEDRREVALTRMLVAVCCVYVVCLTPKVSVALMAQFVRDIQPTGRYSNLYYIISTCMQVLSVINSSVNFFFYWALGSRFRATLRSFCGRSD